MRLIDADVLKYALGSSDEAIYFDALIDEMPTIEPQINDWTPCAEGLPTKDGAYDVTLKSQFGRHYIEQNARFENGEWLTESDTGVVIAWMNHVQPYNHDRKEDAK